MQPINRGTPTYLWHMIAHHPSSPTTRANQSFHFITSHHITSFYIALNHPPTHLDEPVGGECLVGQHRHRSTLHQQQPQHTSVVALCGQQPGCEGQQLLGAQQGRGTLGGGGAKGPQQGQGWLVKHSET